MTTIGHSLSGVSIAILTLPRGRSLLWYLVAGHLFVFFANIPDYPFPGWGHDSYQVSHSIFLAALLASLIGLLRLVPAINTRVSATMFLAFSAAWLLHMPLDSIYSHGHGIGIFWPFSDVHLSMPIPWFETLTWPPKTDHNLRVFAIEAIVYGTVLVMCVIARWVHNGTVK
jgi:membrane-bound metal-dependent hydrolase YbcI (DUF457 family)